MFPPAPSNPARAANWLLIAMMRLNNGDSAGARNCLTMAAAEEPSIIRMLGTATALGASLPRISVEEAEQRLWTLLARDPNGEAQCDASHTTRFSHRLLTALNGSNGFGYRAIANVRNLIEEAQDFVGRFRAMVDSRDFRFVLQPIVDITSRDIHHYEALCRFNQSDESPFTTITFAEEVGLVHEFDLAMAEAVITWLAERRATVPGLRVAVNASGGSVTDPAYCAGIHRLLARNPWAAGTLLLEVTESSRIVDIPKAGEFIQSIRRHGIPVCLDDFGAGAASFQYLSAFNVDVVKIDGATIVNAQQSLNGPAIMQALTQLCHAVGATTIAEMIETEEQRDFCRNCGCDFGQGYLFGRPLENLAESALIA